MVPFPLFRGSHATDANLYTRASKSLTDQVYTLYFKFEPSSCKISSLFVQHQLFCAKAKFNLAELGWTVIFMGGPDPYVKRFHEKASDCWDPMVEAIKSYSSPLGNYCHLSRSPYYYERPSALGSCLCHHAWEMAVHKY